MPQEVGFQLHVRGLADGIELPLHLPSAEPAAPAAAAAAAAAAACQHAPQLAVDYRLRQVPLPPYEQFWVCSRCWGSNMLTTADAEMCARTHRLQISAERPGTMLLRTFWKVTDTTPMSARETNSSNSGETRARLAARAGGILPLLLSTPRCTLNSN